MGEKINQSTFTQSDQEEFQLRLRNETKILMQWFRDDVFDSKANTFGIELEGWLVDENFIPDPKAEAFLKKADDPLIVPELSRFNFEINTPPLEFGPSQINKFHQQVQSVWDKCQNAAHQLKSRTVAIGMLPTIRDEMLTLDYLMPQKRFLALNQQILSLRKGKPLKLDILGHDHFLCKHDDVMLEAAATSLQIHLKLNPSEAVDFYNAGLILSAPMVAATANSPYLFGKDLWAETRIPTFEQAVFVASFRENSGQSVGRVTFGTGYARHSLFELFLENLDGYPPLLPYIIDDDPNWLSHLRLHNGTIWRWNRPIIGIDHSGQPHLRLEHRVCGASPSILDLSSDTAFFIGVIHELVSSTIKTEQLMDFEVVRKNLYTSARDGLSAQIHWFGTDLSVQELLLNVLIPMAKKGLRRLGFCKEDIAHFIDEIFYHRILSGQNGAFWQRSYVATHGPDFQGLTQAYWENQQTCQPVHTWQV